MSAQQRLGCGILAISAALTAWSVPVRGHDLEFTFTVVVIQRDGTYQVDVTADLDALALGVGLGAHSATLANRLADMPQTELDDRLTDVRRTLSAALVLRFDDVATIMPFEFPEMRTMMDAEVTSFLGLTARFTGVIPERAGALTFQADRRFPPVYLTIIDQAVGHDAQQILARGEVSAPHVLGAHDRAETGGTWSIAGQYLRLGFWHIVPEGLDHMLFVLGLFLLSARLAPLLWQVSAFTTAHTITLALSSHGIIALSPAVVEPLIALSITYVAIENLVTDRITRWRLIVVFLFGLLHGLGFAGALGELGLPDRQFLTGLLAFNTGVEAGQLSVLFGAFGLIGWTQRRHWYRSRVSLPCSLVISLVGLYWCLQRVAAL